MAVRAVGLGPRRVPCWQGIEPEALGQGVDGLELVEPAHLHREVDGSAKALAPEVLAAVVRALEAVVEDGNAAVRLAAARAARMVPVEEAEPLGYLCRVKLVGCLERPCASRGAGRRRRPRLLRPDPERLVDGGAAIGAAIGAAVLAEAL